MPSVREIAFAVYGAFLLLRFDRRGLAYFEESVAAFWRSFFAAVIVAPAHVLLIAWHLTELNISAGPLRLVTVEILAYVITWTALPLALYYVTRIIGKEERFIIAVVAINWSAVIQMAISLPVYVSIEAGLLPASAGPIATLGVFVILLVYEWFIARTALIISPMGAAGIVFLDVVLSFTARGAADLMLL